MTRNNHWTRCDECGADVWFSTPAELWCMNCGRLDLQYAAMPCGEYGWTVWPTTEPHEPVFSWTQEQFEMKISEQFAGNYLKAQDLPTPKVFIIESCSLVQMPEGDKKPALKFFQEPQQLVLNKTNAFCLSEWFGDDTTSWAGHRVELYAATTSFSGRMVPCIRLRLPPAAMAPVPVPQPAPVPQQVMQTPVQHHPAPVPQQTMQLMTATVPQPVPVPQMPMQAPAADYPIDA